MRNLIARYGYVEPIDGRSLTVCDGDAVASAHALAIVALFQQRYPRTPCVLLRHGPSREPTDLSLPVTITLQAPFPFEGRRSTRRFLKRTRTRILLIAGAVEQAPARLIDRAYRRGASIVVVLDAGQGREATLRRDLTALQRAAWRKQLDLVMIFGDSYEMPETQGLPVALFTASQLLPAGSEALVARLEPLITPSRRAVSRQRGYHPKHAARLERAEFPLFQALVTRKFRSFDSLEDLDQALGRPKTILCLGNGPSSEDPRLLGYACDSIFRVNASWKARGFLRGEPDLVFTVLPEAIDSLRPRVGFVFKTLEDEMTMRSRYLFKPRRLAFATAERLGVYDRTSFGAFSPTNGAIMLAVAVALRPQRIVIGGMDLFSHPDGAYPGDDKTVNDYTMGHEKALESSFITSLLRAYPGEVEVLSPALRRLLGLPDLVAAGR